MKNNALFPKIVFAFNKKRNKKYYILLVYRAKPQGKLLARQCVVMIKYLNSTIKHTLKVQVVE